MKTLPAHLGCLGLAAFAPLLLAAAQPKAVTFQKQTLTAEYWCDGVNAADLNRDGHPDVIAGPYWYAGPDLWDPLESTCRHASLSIL